MNLPEILLVVLISAMIGLLLAVVKIGFSEHDRHAYLIGRSVTFGELRGTVRSVTGDRAVVLIPGMNPQTFKINELTVVIPAVGVEK